jgi:hypothetical protein
MRSNLRQSTFEDAMKPVARTREKTTFPCFWVGHAAMTEKWRCNICEGQLTVRNGLITCYHNNCEPDFIRADELKREQYLAQDIIDGLPDELAKLYQPKRWSPEDGYICRDCKRKENIKTIYEPWPGICPYCKQFKTLYPIKGENHAD